MIRLLLVRFWPVFLPIVIYLVWLAYARRKAGKNNEPKPGIWDGPWQWAVIATLALALGAFLLLGLSNDANDGVYVPAQMQPDGTVTPGSLEPR